MNIQAILTGYGLMALAAAALGVVAFIVIVPALAIYFAVGPWYFFGGLGILVSLIPFAYRLGHKVLMETSYEYERTHRVPVIPAREGF